MKYVVHCRREPFDVYIGRPSVWGNPFPLTLGTRAEVIEAYEDWIRTQPELVARAKQELKGKVLGCYCAPLPCHGDVLVRIANEEP